MFEKNLFVVDQPAPAFKYHDKTRSGRVEKVADGWVCIELTPGTDPDPAVKFKSFNYHKMAQVG